eukprot:9174476-Alexandrium_andersonii.AAC.1
MSAKWRAWGEVAGLAPRRIGQCFRTRGLAARTSCCRPCNCCDEPHGSCCVLCGVVLRGSGSERPAALLAVRGEVVERAMVYSPIGRCAGWARARC